MERSILPREIFKKIEEVKNQAIFEFQTISWWSSTQKMETHCVTKIIFKNQASSATHAGQGKRKEASPEKEKMDPQGSQSLDSQIYDRR